jgi:beta-glucosidase
VTAVGVDFRDLNKNGRLDPYEDPSRPVEERVEDLLGQMTLAEKAGMLFQPGVGVGDDGSLIEQATPFSELTTSEVVLDRLINHVNIYFTPAPRLLAEWHNRMQQLAEGTRLGIPITLSSDPRNGASEDAAATMSAGYFSEWPEPIGLAAIADPELVREFADIARQEYLAVGIRVALHPMADLGTEPRWARFYGTFGEDAELAARLTAAYVRGFQGERLGPESVACMTKHFPGGGPQLDGEDPHFPYGREQVYPGGNFDYHLIPFEAALEAGTSQVMPYYGMPVGTEHEEVGFGFNRGVITGLLRERYGFDGIVCTDWGLLNDTMLGGTPWPARAWGVEHLPVEERALKVLEAGCDQFGGEHCPGVIVGLVESGKLDEGRLDRSVRRLLREKFVLGLFDGPYVDPEAAERIVGRADFRAAGEVAQRRSIVLLRNGGVLPVSGRPRLYVEGVSRTVAAEYADVVATPEEAELALIRLKAPYEPRDEFFIEPFFHAGDLDFKGDEKARILDLLRRVPTVVDVFLDRPAVIPEIAEASAALLGSFGARDAAVLDVVFGRHPPAGRLPFELPSSMEAVRAQKPDVPRDSDRPLFPFGHGLGYGD